MKSSEIFEVSTALVQSASKQLLTAQLKKKFTKIHYKSETEQVTETDLLISKFYIEEIESKFPDHSIICEESGMIQKSQEYIWVIDPLDGSSNFAAGLPWFGTMLTVFKSGNPIVAVLCAPTSDVVYACIKGGGAYKNDTQFVLPKIPLKSGLFAFSPNINFSTSESDFKLLKSLKNQLHGFRSTASLIDYCYVMDGILAGVMTPRGGIWDVAPLMLFAEECGGVATSISGGVLVSPEDLRKFDRNFSVLFSNPQNHSLISELIGNQSAVD